MPSGAMGSPGEPPIRPGQQNPLRASADPEGVKVNGLFQPIELPVAF